VNKMSENIESPEEIELSMSEQMERTSVNISTFSALHESSGMPFNFPVILGGEDIIKDEVVKLKVEEAFGQLNIQSLFGFEDQVLQSVIYNTFRTDNADDKLTPYIYLLKSYTKNVYLLNYLATPYADLNIDAYFVEVDFMSRALSGVFRRTTTQEEMGLHTEEKVHELCKDTVDTLVGYMHYQIFTERGMRNLVSQVRTQIAMILGMFIEFKIDTSELQCVGKCGNTFAADDVTLDEKAKSEMICSNCGGEMVKAPPILKFSKVQYLYPPGSDDVILSIDPNGLNPITYLGYLSGVMMPRNLATTVNRLSPTHFGTLATVPSKVSFSKNDGSKIQLNTNYRLDGDKLILFVSISDSKFAVRKYDDIFIPALSAITLNRDMVEGFKKGYTLKQIIRSSIISDWVLTDLVDVDDLGKFEKISEIKSQEE